MISQYNDRKYKEICSEKTLQANSEGFFVEFVGNISRNLGENFLNAFGKLNSDLKRIQAVTHHDQARSLVTEVLANITEVYRGKNEANAELLKIKAEQCLEQEKYSEAVQFFSQSILKSPNKSAGLAVAFLGRAGALLNNPTLALIDIQTALKLGLAEDLKAKTFVRMAECYSSLGEHKRSEVSLKLAQKLEPSLTRSPIKTPELQKPKPILPTIENPHEKYTNASKQIQVNHSEATGRFIEASRAVKPGDTLVIEPAFAACLFPERFGTHCQHCFERLQAPYPCEECSNVAFCGPECKENAAGYHKFECKFLELLIGSGMSALGYIALRMVTQSDIYQNIEDYERRVGVYGLCTNAAARDGFDFFQRTLMALFLFRVLKTAGYFGAATTKGSVLPTTAAEYKTAEMLLFNLQMLQFNAHEVTEKLYAEEQDRFKNTRPLEIGVAVYPTAALFNHACYPAVTRYFMGKHIVIKATRPLQPGDVIAENYGPIFMRRTLPQRQAALKGRYWFDCQCLACTENWPVLKSSPDYCQERIRCPNCPNLFTLPLRQITIKCPKCENQVDLSENLGLLEQCKENYKKADELMAAQKPQEAIKLLCPALDLFHKISAPPNKATHLAEDLLRACFCDFGNSHGGCTVKTNKFKTLIPNK